MPVRASPDLRHERGPFDIIGDVHGCADELEGLLAALGWTVELGRSRVRVEAPKGRRAIFVGDLVDRGPRSPDVLRLVMAMADAKLALAVPGNHDEKFLRWLHGRQVKLAHGLERTVAQLEREPADFRVHVAKFLGELPSHLWLEDGRLAVAHAGIKAHMLGKTSKEVLGFCLYGETSGETDEFGLPVRYDWAAAYAGSTAVVYGHTPVPEPEWVNGTICIDTGCCFGGRLSALRWPEREIVSVPAAQAYAASLRPFGRPAPRPVANTPAARSVPTSS